MRKRPSGTVRAAEMAALIAACDRSGAPSACLPRNTASRRERCRGGGIPWACAAPIPRAVGFEEVTPSGPPSTRTTAAPSGTRVCIPAHFEAAPLETLLGVLRRTC